MKKHLDFVLDGKPYKLQASAKALMRVCEEVADPVEMLVDWHSGALPNASRMFRIFHIVLVESGNPGMSEEKAYAALFRRGVGELHLPLVHILSALTNGGEFPEDEDPDEAAKKAKG